MDTLGRLFVEKRDSEITKENQKLPTSEQKRKATGIKKENLVRRILDWSRDDKSIRSAFKETGRKKRQSKSAQLGRVFIMHQMQ